MSKIYIFTLIYLSINDGNIKNILQDIKQYKQRQHRMKNVNLFIISAPFDILLVIQIMLFEIPKNLGKSPVTHILLAEEQTTEKSKYIKD